MDNSNTFKVRLESYSHGASTVPTSSIIFDVMPTISENVQVEYQALDPLHMPGSFHTYKGTKARTFELGEVKLVSRTSEEASRNQGYVNILRSWTKPYFGMNAGGSNVPTSTTAPGPKFTYMTKEGNGPISDAKLRPMTLDETKRVLNARQTDAKFREANKGLVVPQYARGTTSPQETAFLNSQKMKDEVTRALDNANADTTKLLSIHNSSDVNVPDRSIIRVQTADANSFGGASGSSGGASGFDSDLNLLGAPPDLLYLTAYSDARDLGGRLDRPVNLFRVPVVITGLSITYPNDVDYIPTVQDQPFPIIMSISISLTESNSPREMEKFDLAKYREGVLPGF